MDRHPYLAYLYSRSFQLFYVDGFANAMPPQVRVLNVAEKHLGGQNTSRRNSHGVQVAESLGRTVVYYCILLCILCCPIALSFMNKCFDLRVMQQDEYRARFSHNYTVVSQKISMKDHKRH